MKYSYERYMRVELSQNPKIDDILEAVKVLREKAASEFGDDWIEDVAVVSTGGFPAPSADFPSIIFSARAKQ